MSLSFSYLADIGAFYSSAYKESDFNFIAPFVAPSFGGFCYVQNGGDYYAMQYDGSDFTFTPLSAFAPASGIVVTADTVYFFQDGGAGSGDISASTDGTTFSDSAYTTDAANPLYIFFTYAGIIYAIDEQGNVCSGEGGITDFLLNAQTFPNGDLLDYWSVGEVAGIGACFFQASGLAVQFVTYSGEFSTPAATDLPEIDNAAGYFWSFALLGDVFYALRYHPSDDDPATSVNVLYSSIDGVTWTLETSDIFGALRNYVSLFQFNETIIAGFGETSGAVELTTVYSTSASVPASQTSGNQAVTGGGINGSGGAVGFSKVATSMNVGQSIEALAYPAGIIANGNDFGIDLGL